MINYIGKKGFWSAPSPIEDEKLNVVTSIRINGGYGLEFVDNATPPCSFSFFPPQSLSQSYGLVFPHSLPSVLQQVLTTDLSGNLSWIAMPTGSGSVSSVSGTNVGGGANIFASTSNTNNLVFRTLTAGTNLTLSSPTPDLVEINVAIPTASGVNIGTGAPVFSSSSNSVFSFKTLKVGSNLFLSESSTELFLSGVASSTVTLTNIGTGVPLYSGFVNGTGSFKTLVAGAGIILSASSTEVLVSTTSAVQLVFSAANQGSGFQVLSGSSAGVLGFRTLAQGSNIFLSYSGNTIVLSGSDVSNFIAQNVNLGSGEGLFALQSAQTASFKSLVGGTNVVVTGSANNVIVSVPSVVVGGENLGTGQGLFLTTSANLVQLKSVSSYTPASLFVTSSNTEVKVGSVGLNAAITLTEDWVAGTTAGQTGWIAAQAGTGAASALVGTDVDTASRACGVVQLTTGTTATGRAALSQGLTAFVLANLSSSSVEMRAKVPALTTPSESFYVDLGWCNTTAAGEQVNGLYFFYTGSLGDQWRAVVASASVRTYLSTSVSVSTASYQKFRVDTTNNSNTASFYIDDVLVATASSNIPRLAQLGLSFRITKNVGLTARTFRVDYASMNGIMGIPR